MFYRANPTEALLLVKDKIENTPQVNIAVEDLKIDAVNTCLHDLVVNGVYGFRWFSGRGWGWD